MRLTPLLSETNKIRNMSEVKSFTTLRSSDDDRVQSYNELGQDFNLNLPPTNWLRGASVAKQPWVPSAVTDLGDFSSITTANCHIDSVGSVDVISSGERVKQILKLPYNQEALSLVVHRVGKTLLIDSLDVYKQILKVQEDDWKWIRDFIVENLVESRNQNVPLAAQRQEIEEKLMLSKFLYHSIENEPSKALVPRGSRYIQPPDVITDPLEDENEGIEIPMKHEKEVLWTFEDITMLVGTDIPIFGSGKHPAVSLRLRDMRKPINVLTGLDYWLDQLMANVPECAMCYHLNGIVQKYEIIPTEDLPKVAGSQFSPELVRDVAQNILSFLKSNATKEGHTYWLFKDENDDVVKLYDLSSVCKGYLEEDLSDVNPFTLPVAILMYRVAKNLLHNTQEPKRAANTVFRLLNNCLSLLSRDKYPQVVGSIHYLLANVYLTYGTSSTENSSSSSGNTKASPKRKKNKDSLKGATPTNPFPDPPEYEIDDEWALDGQWMVNSTNETSSCVALDVLKRPGGTYEHVTMGAQPKPLSKKALPNSSNLEDCCKQALEFIYEGLDCADVLLKQGSSKECQEESCPPQPDPEEAIPLQYEPIKKNPSSAGLLPAAVRHPLRASWQNELVCLLLNRAGVAYSCLADLSLALGHFGRTLRHAKFGMVCLEAVLKMSDLGPDPSKTCLRRCKEAAKILLPVLLSHCGHAYFSLYQTDPSLLARHSCELDKGMHFRDIKICEKARNFLMTNKKEDLSWATAKVPEPVDGPLKLLQLAEKCLTVSIEKMNKNQLNTNQNQGKYAKNQQKWSGTGDLENAMPKIETAAVTRMLGNVKNEIGKFYTTLLTERVTTGEASQWEFTVDFADNSSKIENLSNLATRSFREGVALFSSVQDNSNQALLQANAGRLFRLRAHKAAAAGEEFSKEEKKFYFEAIECYQQALCCLDRVPGRNVWEAVAHELASSYHAMATQLQNRPPIGMQTQQEIVLEIVDYMKRALGLYERILGDSNMDTKVQTALSEKIFEVHYQLAGLHFKLMMDKDDPWSRKWKQLKQTTEEHYTKAADMYKNMILPKLGKDHLHMRCIRKSLVFLRMQLERVASIEYIIELTASPQAKSRVVCQALHILVKDCAEDLNYLAECFKGATVKEIKDTEKNSGSESESDTEQVLNEKDVTAKEEREAQKKEIDAGLVGELRLLGKTFLDRCQVLAKAQLQLAIQNSKGKSKSSSEASAVDHWKLAFKHCLVTVPDNPTDYPLVLNNLCENLAKFV